MSAHWRQQALPEVACLHVWLRSTLVSLLGAAGAAGKQRGALLRTWRQRDNKERAALVARSIGGRMMTRRPCRSARRCRFSRTRPKRLRRENGIKEVGGAKTSFAPPTTMNAFANHRPTAERSHGSLSNRPVEDHIDISMYEAGRQELYKPAKSFGKLLHLIRSSAFSSPICQDNHPGPRN